MNGASEQARERLLLSVAEQLKLPLLQIASLTELDDFTSLDQALARRISTSSLRLIDNYILGLKLGSTDVNTELITASSLMYDAAQDLRDLARDYNVRLELQIEQRFAPVLGCREGLQAALVSLGAAIIEALPANGAGANQLTLQLVTHKTRQGIVAGVYSRELTLTSQDLKRARVFQGEARQPLPNLSPNSGAGIFVAESILQAMDLELISSRYNGGRGLGTILNASPQLSLL